MKKHTKLVAFTVMELVIALVLMSIVVSIAYTALSMSSKQLGNFEHRFGIENEYRLLQSALQRDVNEADSLLLLDGQLVCETPGMSIRYQLLDSTLVRQQQENPADTFHFLVDSVYYGFESQPQQAEGGKIDEIHWHLRRDDIPFLLYQDKIYDARQLMPSSPSIVYR